MTRGLRLKRLFYISLLGLSGFSTVRAQNGGDRFSQADAVLTSAYKQALARFSPQNQEILRRAERAWIAFSNKQETVLNALQRDNLLGQEAVDLATIQEVHARSNHLNLFFAHNFPVQNQSAAFAEEDRQLGRVYAQCMSKLRSSHQKLLREAERSWIEYRDADSNSVYSAYPSSLAHSAAAAHLTSVRVSQLTALTGSLGQPASLPVIPSPPPKPASPNPDDAKAVSQTLADAKTLILALLSKKDDPFFKPAGSVKNLPELPAEISGAVGPLTERFDRLSESEGAQNLLEAGVGEYRTVALLSAWSSFTRQLKTGDASEAPSALNSALERKPKTLNPDYAVLWQTVENWKPLYTKAAAEFQEHVKKARSLAELGKNSDAIREYEAAFALIENSSIPAEIKKLREQSLGL